MDNLQTKDKVNNYQYFIEKSNDDKYIIKIKDLDKNNTFYIGSKYSVQRDIDKFIEQIKDFNVSTIFLVFGIGAGEHIVNLQKKIGEKNKILVIEPDKKVIDCLKENSYYDEIIKDKRVWVSELNTDINHILSSFVDEININNIKLMVFANYDRIYESKFKEFYKKLNDFLLNNIINMNTNISFSEQFFKCYINNLKCIFNSVLINEFRDKLKNIPAVIVSAGPSLEKNIDLLREVTEKFVIVTGIRTVNSLKVRGISPDFVCAVDPSEEMYKVAEDSLDCKAPLLFCECTNYKIVKEYEGEKIFFQEGINLKKVTPEILNVKVDPLWSGGSVAHTCTAFARYMGCNPIIFIGQDFAYTYDKYHAESANKENNNIINSDDTIFVESIDGGEVRTSKILDTYRKNMEDFIRVAKDTMFINSTEGGSNIRGTKVQPLRNVIDEYSQKNNFNYEFEKIMNKFNGVNKVKVLEKIIQLSDNLEDLKEKCALALDYSNKFLDSYKTDNEINIKPLLDRTNEINNIIYKIEFIENLLKPTIYRFLMNPEYIERMNETKEEMEYRLARQVKDLYEGIIKSIDESIPYVKECIEELN